MIGATPPSSIVGEDQVESETIARINLAVDDILQRCAGGASLSECMDDALAELRQKGWSDGEVELVHSIAERVFKEREIS
jgi:hypothetical protein